MHPSPPPCPVSLRLLSTNSLAVFASAQQNSLGIEEREVCQAMAGALVPVVHRSPVNAGERGCSNYSSQC